MKAALVACYGKFSDLGYARKVFDKMHEKSLIL